MHKLFKQLGLHAQLFFIFSQVVADLDSRRTVAYRNAAEHIGEQLIGQNKLVQIVDVNAGQHRYEQLNDIDLCLLLECRIEEDKFAWDRDQAS